MTRNFNGIFIASAIDCVISTKLIPLQQNLSKCGNFELYEAI